MKSIAMVGVGRMGANMARRLAERGFTVAAVTDLHGASSAALAAELKCVHARRLTEITASADCIITVVTDDAAQRAIYFEPSDNLLMGARGKLFINCATLTPAVHVEIAAAAAREGAESLEACMASSIPQARDGTLYLMCGGTRETFERAKPVLDALGSTIRYIGPAGTAAQVKALVNLVMNINTAGLAEGLGLGAALGLDLSTLREVFGTTGASSRVLVTDGEDMQKRDHACFFSAAHAAKDSGIALELARAVGLNLPLAAATKAQYLRMVALGLGELDKSGVAELTFPGRGK